MSLPGDGFGGYGWPTGHAFSGDVGGVPCGVRFDCDTPYGCGLPPGVRPLPFIVYRSSLLPLSCFIGSNMSAIALVTLPSWSVRSTRPRKPWLQHGTVSDQRSAMSYRHCPTSRLPKVKRFVESLLRRPSLSLSVARCGSVRVVDSTERNCSFTRIYVSKWSTTQLSWQCRLKIVPLVVLRPFYSAQWKSWG